MALVAMEMPRHADTFAAHGLGSDVFAVRVAAGQSGWFRNVSRLAGLDVQVAGVGRGVQLGHVDPGMALVPNSSKIIILAVNGDAVLAPNVNGLAGRSVGTL
jgi:hypothetical protein